MKGAPQRQKFAKMKEVIVTGLVIVKEPNKRMSWQLKLLWIIIPAVKNNKALNIAWVIKWKKANLG